MSERESTVTDEMVETAAKALYEVEWREALGGRPWDLADEGERPYWRESARAAVSSALPLIVAGEREKLLRMVDGMADEWAGYPSEATYRNLALAIRADKGGE